MRKYSLYFAWLIAACGTLFSLYYSEVAGHIPCKLCWYQRICLFPLTLLLFPVIWKKQHSFALYYLPLPLVGFSLSFFICQNCTATQPLAALSGVGFAMISGLIAYTAYCSSGGSLSRWKRKL